MQKQKAIKMLIPLAVVAVGWLVFAMVPGCTGAPPPPMPSAKAPTDIEPEGAEQAAEPEEEEQVQYFYTPIGKRDPFRPFYLDLQTNLPGSREGERKEGPRTPLEQFELEQLQLVAIISGISTPRAMVEAPDGKGYIIRQGTPIGKNGGRVARIKRDEVVIEEEYFDGNLKRILNRVRMRLRPEQEELSLTQ